MSTTNSKAKILIIGDDPDINNLFIIRRHSLLFIMVSLDDYGHGYIVGLQTLAPKIREYRIVG
jgi:hypothetical protein